MQYLCYHWSVLRSKLFFAALTKLVTLFLCFFLSSSFLSRLSLSRSFIALIISDDSHWGSVGCLTRLFLIGACFSTTGRKASYQAVSAWFGSEKLKTLTKGARLKSQRKASWSKCLKQRYWTVVWPLVMFLGCLHDHVQMTGQWSLTLISETRTFDNICSLFVYIWWSNVAEVWVILIAQRICWRKPNKDVADDQVGWGLRRSMLKSPRRTMFGLLSQTLSIICTKSSNQVCVAAGFLYTYPTRTAGEAGCFISTHVHSTFSYLRSFRLFVKVLILWWIYSTIPVWPWSAALRRMIV